jgi:hypothetical protein
MAPKRTPRVETPADQNGAAPKPLSLDIFPIELELLYLLLTKSTFSGVTEKRVAAQLQERVEAMVPPEDA